MDRDDPRLAIEAPIRRALGSLVMRGLGLVAIVLLAVLCPVVPALHHFDDTIAVLVPALLFAYALVIFVERRRRGRPPEELRAAAWFKAREIDDVLARSIAESDKAFRNYWANLGR